MSSPTAPVIEPRRGVNCVSGRSNPVPLVGGHDESLGRAHTVSEMDHRKRQAIVVQRQESLSTNPQLSSWAQETGEKEKRVLASHRRTNSERRSDHGNREEVFTSKGTVRRDTLRRKPVPPIPSELFQETSHATRHVVHFPSSSSSSSSLEGSPRSMVNTGSTLTGSPKSVVSSLRTLVDEDDSDWELIDSDLDSDGEHIQQNPHTGVPPAIDFIRSRSKAAVSFLL